MKRTFAILFVWFWMCPSLLFGQSILTTPHNLSTSGFGSVTANSESRICIFCHTPHNGRPAGPSWNRDDPGQVYTLYGSSTLDALPGQPDGSSIMCLSCHDGTIALGNIASQQQDIDFAPITTMPIGGSNLSTDLRDDHPISFLYDASLATTDGQLKLPSMITPPVGLTDQKVQCTSCHDPHVNIYTDFLVAPTQYSAICLSCHDKTYWPTSSHQSSTATWNGSSPDPWPNSAYTNVAENACANCHDSHGSGGVPRLLISQTEETNCLKCHNANVASTDIESQLTKPYLHNVYAYQGNHDPAEANAVSSKHVECVDCHNPHATNNTAASAPNANGYLAGVKGVDQTGNPIETISFEYELCYRCHSSTLDKPASPTNRLIEQNDVRLEFDLSNPSYHPVVGPGVNPNVPSLIPPLNTSSVIYCTDCHASNGNGSPNGPHGSIYPHILKYRYETGNNVTESFSTYELCYQCHDRAKIIASTRMGGMNNFQKDVHRKHITGEDVSCNTCHDPHGISATQGNSSHQSHLINFDLSIVSPNSQNQLYFQDDGEFAGRCFLKCHGENHTPKSYN